MTEKQKKTLDVITAYINENGFSPSYPELMELLNLKSKSNVHARVMQLVDRGKIKIMKYRARSIELIDGS